MEECLNAVFLETAKLIEAILHVNVYFMVFYQVCLYFDWDTRLWPPENFSLT